MKNKNQFWNVLMWSGMLASHLVVVFTLVAIFTQGAIAYTETNNLILWIELIVSFIVLYFMFTTIFDHLHDKIKELKRRRDFKL